MILCIETATKVCSVALCDHNNLVAYRENHEGRSHASDLTPFIQEVLDEAGITASDIDAVAVSKGPGSYTGLRIGVSTAKGIAFATGKPLIAVDTLNAMFHGLDKDEEKEGKLLYAPMLDARRMEVYYSLIRPDGTTYKETAAEIITSGSFAELTGEYRLILFGDGAEKCRDILPAHNIEIIPAFTVSARYMHIPSLKAYNDGKFEDTAYFEPFYLKDFVTTIPKKLSGL